MKIVMLDGSPVKDGTTNVLATRFVAGAQEAGHAQEIKKNGAKYCDCPACTACAAILAKKAELLK